MKNLKKILITFTLTAATVLTISTISKSATTLKVTGDTLNIRKSPSTDSKVVAMLFKGVECEMISEEGDWYKIKYKTYTGYVSKEYVKIVNEEKTTTTDNNTENNNQVVSNNTSNEETTNETTGQNNKDENQETDTIVYKKVKQDTTVKILPLIYSSNIETLKKNKSVVLVNEISGWSYIQTEYNCGWVRTEYLEDTKAPTTSDNKNDNQDNNTDSYTEKTAYISESSVNMRKGAGTSYNIVKVLSLNTQLTIIGEDGKWYKVKTGNTTGYVSKEFVSDSKVVTTRSNSVSRTENKTTQKVETTTEKNTSKEDTKVSTSNNTTKDDNTTIKGTDIVAYAKKYLGYKYVYGGDGSNGTFDCSGYTMYVYKHFGINIPHGANSQYRCGKGKKITKYSELQVGDIVFLTDYETGKGIGHCGIYLGNDNFIHASTTCYAVEISSFKTIYKGRFYSALRLI